ncbi:hypothetical protein ACNKHU_08005 [Shigella flexneri]
MVVDSITFDEMPQLEALLIPERLTRQTCGTSPHNSERCAIAKSITTQRRIFSPLTSIMPLVVA